MLFVGRCGKPDVCAGEGFHGIGIVGRTANGLQIYCLVATNSRESSGCSGREYMFIT